MLSARLKIARLPANKLVTCCLAAAACRKLRRRRGRRTELAPQAESLLLFFFASISLVLIGSARDSTGCSSSSSCLDFYSSCAAHTLSACRASCRLCGARAIIVCASRVAAAVALSSWLAKKKEKEPKRVRERERLAVGGGRAKFRCRDEAMIWQKIVRVARAPSVAAASARAPKRNGHSLNAQSNAAAAAQQFGACALPPQPPQQQPPPRRREPLYTLRAGGC